MKKSQQSRPIANEENVYRTSKCPCPGNPQYARKNDRTPLGVIQDLVNKNQYLTAEHGHTGKSGIGTKSVSQTLSPIERQSGLRQIQAESTRITSAPPIKHPLTKLLAGNEVRPIQRTESLKPSQNIAVRARSSSCRCPGNQKKLNNDEGVIPHEDNNNAVFLPPPQTHTRTQLKPSQVSSCQPKISIISCQSNELKRGGTITVHKARSAENLSQAQSLKSGQQSQSTSKTAPKSQQSTQDGEDFVPWIAPKLLASKQPLSSCSTKFISKTKQNSELTQNVASKNSTTSKKNQCCSKTAAASIKNQGCCSTRSTTKMEQNYVTLPSQRFVTLSQDTLKTTIGSERSVWEPTTSALSKVKVVRDSSIFSEEERTFVDGQAFFQDLEQRKRSSFKTMPVCSPLSISVSLRRSNSLSDGETAKRVKTTLKRKGSTKKIIVYSLMYSEEYIKDIISYSYRQRNNFLLKPEWIEIYMDKRCRTMTLDWLLEVMESIVTQFAPIYYMAVRIFDYTIIKLKLRNISYQLAAIVAFWISLKYLNNTVLLKIPKIYSLCKGKYSKEEIVSMERTILKSTNFCLNLSDPLDFLHFYLKSSNLESNELLKYGSKFVMECATLFENSCTIGSAFLAASALWLAYGTIANTQEVYLNFVWYEATHVQQYADSVLKYNVKSVIMNKYEPFNKYLTVETLQVAKAFFSV